jgi:hypothetical protein
MALLENPAVPLSWGELIDKITILEIKRERIGRPDAIAHVAREHQLLTGIGALALQVEAVRLVYEELRSVNAALWEIEDRIRAAEASRQFGPGFVRLARSVYKTNDRRALLKRRINDLLGSDLVEEKSYLTAALPADPLSAAAR